MGLFRKKTPAPEPVRKDQIRRLIKLGMAETDAADRDIDNANPRQFNRAKALHDAAISASTLAERRAASEALRRHGY